MSNTYHISAREWLILRCLWKRSPLGTKDIPAMLEEETGWNANMIRTLVLRLQEKGAVGSQKGARYYRYFPLAEEQECVLAETRSFLNRVFEGSPVRMIAALTGGGTLTEKERQEIQKLLDSMGKET